MTGHPDLPAPHRRYAGDAALVSLTYISECRIPAEQLGREIEAFLVRARTFRQTRTITGALLYTGQHFVQTLEGRPIVLDALTRIVQRDRRQFGLHVIDRRAITTRTFPLWSMAYAGPSVFVARSLERARLPSHPNQRVAVQRLLRLIAEFARLPAV